MAGVLARLRDQAKRDPKVIAFPEYDDDRVLKAIDIIKKEGIAKPFLLTPDNLDAKRQEEFAAKFFERKQAKGVTSEEARKTMNDPMYYAAMMCKYGFADGLVSGAKLTTAAVLRAVINCMSIDRRDAIVTSCFIMEVPDCAYGEQGTFIYADCGVIPSPSAEQLSRIASAAARFAKEALDIEPRVAFLSFSSKGSAEGRWIDKIKEAVAMVKARNLPYAFDGELQADSAIVPEVASRKLKDSPVAGKANVLIFPDLDAGNICYKLTERLAKARAIGPITLGTVEPCSDLSRGCSVDDIVDAAAVTVVRAQKRALHKSTESEEA